MACKSPDHEVTASGEIEDREAGHLGKGHAASKLDALTPGLLIQNLQEPVVSPAFQPSHPRPLGSRSARFRLCALQLCQSSQEGIGIKGGRRAMQPRFLMTKLLKTGLPGGRGPLGDSQPNPLLLNPPSHSACCGLVPGQPQGGAGPYVAGR